MLQMFKNYVVFQLQYFTLHFAAHHTTYYSWLMKKFIMNTSYRRVHGWCCGGSWLTLAFVVSVVTLTQLWLLLYFLSTWDASPVTHIVYTDDLGNVSMS